MPGFHPNADDEKRIRRQALVASLLLHLVVVVALMLGIPHFSRDQVTLLSVPVEMLTEEDLLAERVARSEAEAVEEAEAEALSEAEVEEATAETLAESASDAQPERLAAAEAPQPSDSQVSEAVSEAAPLPPLPPQAPDRLPPESRETATEVVASAELAEGEPIVPSVEEAPAATTEEASQSLVEAPEAELAELAPAPEEAQAEEVTAMAPQEVTPTEVQSPEDLPPAPRRRPQDAPAQIQQAQTQAEPQPQSQPDPQARTEPRVEEQPSEPDPEEEFDALASILRNVEQLEPQQSRQAAAPTPADNSVAPRTSIAVQRRAAELGDMIREQVASCWRIDGGIQEARSLRIPIRVQLSADGHVIGSPTIQEPGRYASDGYYRSAADAAVRAVLRCAPLKLPPQDYDIWHDLVLNFDPREMFGG